MPKKKSASSPEDDGAMSQPVWETPARRSLLRPLGIVGYDAVEPALLAALATEEPLLLISEHGAAKTLMLVRLARALGVELRHYNASLLQFDDLAGFPIPDDRGGVRYAAPAGAIWEAQAVFFDEIGRCRPEVANKLFPIVHERRIQGVALERLRYRWAATNPPPEAQEQLGDYADGYEGVERLDPALADRFSFIVPLPRYADLSDDDRRRVIAGTDTPPSAHDDAAVRELVAATRALLPTVRESHGDMVTGYVHALTSRLHALAVATGGRRAATLWRNVLAVHAACLVLGRPGDERAVCAALFASIPDIVRRVVPRSVLLAAHQTAWREAAMSPTDPVHALPGVRDPRQRVALALALPDVPVAVRGEVLCEALSAMPEVECRIFAWQLFPRVLRDGALPATAVEMVAEVVARIAGKGIEVRGYAPQREWATQARAVLAASALPDAELEYLHGVVTSAYGLPESATGFDPNGGARGAVQHVLEVRARCIALLGAPLTGAESRAGMLDAA